MPAEIGQIELVETESRLAEVVARVSSAPRVAVDLESNGFFRYHERVCLVQLAAVNATFLIDPLAMDDLRPLGALLADPSVEKVFHAADYDIRSLDRDWGFHVSSLFDTSIAAALVGSSQLGLKAVVEDQLDVELSKNPKLQRSDWTKRPLSSEALKYAADDVLHLARLRDVLSARLEKLSRLEWAREEFERLASVRHTPADRESAFLSVKGGRDLDGRGLAVLRSLFQFREGEASRLDRPLFKVIPDSALILLSAEPATDLSPVRELGRFRRPPDNRRLKAAIDEGLASKPAIRPKRKRTRDPLSPAERKRAAVRLKSLKAWRNQLGQELQLSPGLLWPAVSLERLSRCPSGLDSELADPKVRYWQKREFGAALRGVLATLS